MSAEDPQRKGSIVTADPSRLRRGDDLIGPAEAREICGNVPPSTLSRWQRSGEFPPPVATPRVGPIFRRADVEAFAKARAARD